MPERTSQKIVLAIDDNPDGIDIIRKYLGEEYTVIGLLSGEDAVERARGLRPLAITLDILMPGMDGWQVLRDLKENSRNPEYSGDHRFHTGRQDGWVSAWGLRITW